MRQKFLVRIKPDPHLKRPLTAEDINNINLGSYKDTGIIYRLRQEDNEWVIADIPRMDS